MHRLFSRFTKLPFSTFAILLFTIIATNLYGFSPDVFQHDESILYLVGTDRSQGLVFSVDQEEAGEIQDNRAIFLRVKAGPHTIGIYGQPDSRTEILFESERAYFLSYDPQTGFVDVIPAEAMEVRPLNYPFETIGTTPDNTPIADQKPAARSVHAGFSLTDLTESTEDGDAAYRSSRFIGLKYGLTGMSWHDRSYIGSQSYTKDLEPGFGVIMFSAPYRLTPYLAWTYEIDINYDKFKHYHELPFERTTAQFGGKIIIGDMSEGHPGIYGALTFGVTGSQLRGYSPMVLGTQDMLFQQLYLNDQMNVRDFDTVSLYNMSRDSRSNKLLLAAFWNKRGTPEFEYLVHMDLWQNGYYENPINLMNYYSQSLTGTSLNPNTRSLYAAYLAEARLRKMDGFYKGIYMGTELNLAVYGLYLSFRPSVYVLYDSGGSDVQMDQGNAEIGLYVKI